MPISSVKVKRVGPFTGDGLFALCDLPVGAVIPMKSDFSDKINDLDFDLESIITLIPDRVLRALTEYVAEKNPAKRCTNVQRLRYDISSSSSSSSSSTQYVVIRPVKVGHQLSKHYGASFWYEHIVGAWYRGMHPNPIVRKYDLRLYGDHIIAILTDWKLKLAVRHPQLFSVSFPIRLAAILHRAPKKIRTAQRLKGTKSIVKAEEQMVTDICIH